jgi:hypothetical protein
MVCDGCYRDQLVVSDIGISVGLQDKVSRFGRDRPSNDLLEVTYCLTQR